MILNGKVIKVCFNSGVHMSAYRDFLCAEEYQKLITLVFEENLSSNSI